MINFLNNWVQQIVVAVIVVSIFELILPNGNLKKYIKVVLGIYVVFCIISPFVDSMALYKLENIDLEKYIEENSSKNAVNQESMDLRLQQIYIEELEKDINEKVKEYGYKVSKCNVDADLNTSSKNPGIHKIDLILNQDSKTNIEKIQIGSNDKNENEEIGKIEEIKGDLANYYEINKDIINIKIK